jgi:acetylornithine deacetylase/succinyl-diaminopimelate desuccinylase-like protein
VQKRLVEAVADPSITVALASKPGPVSPAPPLMAAIMKPIEKLVAEIWPGVPVIPSISTGATDGRFLLAAGIPTYGVSGIFVDPDGNGVHGLNERVRVKSLLDGRVFLHSLVKTYASAR